MAKREKRLRGFQRIAEPGGCDWCAMLASRGPVYYSHDTAAAGSHDNCRCVIAPIFVGDTWAKDAQDRATDRYTGKISREEDAKHPIGEAIKQAQPGMGMSPEVQQWLDDLPQLDRPETYAEASYSANPGAAVNPATGQRPPEYLHNCHQVAPAMEMRARGYDVIARETMGTMGRTSYSIAADWVDPTTGLPRIPTFAPEGSRSVTKFLAQATEEWPDGARGFISGRWKGARSGHIFNVQKIDGKLVLAEGQTAGNAYDYVRRELRNSLAPSTVDVLRVDDLVPAPGLREKVVAAPSTQPIVTPASQRAYAEARIARLKTDIDSAAAASAAAEGAEQQTFYRRLLLSWGREVEQLEKLLSKVRD